MKLGYIGLGKMGFDMVERFLEKGYEVAVFDKNNDAIKEISMLGAEPAGSLKSLISSLEAPRLIWLMVPYQVVDSVIGELSMFLKEGDTIDGANRVAQCESGNPLHGEVSIEMRRNAQIIRGNKAE